MFDFQVGSAIKAAFIRRLQGGIWKDTLISKQPLLMDQDLSLQLMLKELILKFRVFCTSHNNRFKH